MGPTTPLRVRGKRRRPPRAASPAATTAAAAGAARQPLAAVLARRRSRPRRRRGVGLESLPAELLELVLLYSCSLALPRASPLLGARLSGRATLLRLVMAVFHDTWDQCFGGPCADETRGDPDLQVRTHPPRLGLPRKWFKDFF